MLKAGSKTFELVAASNRPLGLRGTNRCPRRLAFEGLHHGSAAAHACMEMACLLRSRTSKTLQTKLANLPTKSGESRRETMVCQQFVMRSSQVELGEAKKAAEQIVGANTGLQVSVTFKRQRCACRAVYGAMLFRALICSMMGQLQKMGGQRPRRASGFNQTREPPSEGHLAQWRGEGGEGNLISPTSKAKQTMREREGSRKHTTWSPIIKNCIHCAANHDWCQLHLTSVSTECFRQPNLA